MPPRRRRQADEALALALACGSNIEKAAQQCGVSRRTAHRRLADPAFQRRIQALRADMLERTAGMLTAAGLESVRVLVDLLKTSQPTGVRLRAAKTVLDSGAKVRETADLEARIRAVEEMLRSQGRL